MADDWRIRIEVEDVHDHLLERLGVQLDDEAKALASALQHQRLAVSRDGDEIFVYAPTRAAARQAQAVIESQVRSLGLVAKASRIEHWLEDDERWDDEPKQETWEEEVLDEGYAPWEVRVECSSHEEAEALADSLEQEGLGVARRWRYLVVGASSREEAEALAERLHGTVEAGGEVVYEAMPHNPFAIFGGLGG